MMTARSSAASLRSSKVIDHPDGVPVRKESLDANVHNSSAIVILSSLDRLMQAKELRRKTEFKDAAQIAHRTMPCCRHI